MKSFEVRLFVGVENILGLYMDGTKRCLKILTRIPNSFENLFFGANAVILGFAKRVLHYTQGVVGSLLVTSSDSRPEVLGRIIGKLEEGRSVTSVAAEFRIAHSIVSRLWRQFQTTGTAIRGFSSGRPRGTTPADDRYIVLQARRNRWQTAGEIARQTTQATGRPISRFTVARRLHGGGLFARRPVRCVPLSPAHRRRCSLCCREHRKWRDNEWRRVLFTDESRFSLSSDSHRILIWRERGSRNHPSNIIERDRYGGRGVLVWGGIMLGSRTDLHIFDAGSVNGTRYCNEILLPYVRLFRGAMGLQFLFMDDNAPCHRTVAAEQLLESEDIERMDWPARSPDLNPIEHVWDFLGRRLAARTLRPVTIREIRLALQDEWAAVPQQLIDTLILSMGRRCETCLAVRGEVISPTKDRMFLAGYPSQECFGLQSHCTPCYFFNQASFYPSDFFFTTRGLLATDHVILNHGQVTWTTPDLAPPLLTTTPHQREDVSALDRFNVHRCPTRRVFSGTGLELLTRQTTVRYLYYSATAATMNNETKLVILKYRRIKAARLLPINNPEKNSVWQIANITGSPPDIKGICYASQTRCQFLLEASPIYEWYDGNHPDVALLGLGSRRDETSLARFRSGHTRAQRHMAGLKVHPSRPNCNVTQASPAHISACIGFHKSQLLSSPATVLQCLKTHGSWT
ncbi:transposable element Tcb2 transposase [Trichonephila clavipes]|nr:transposable element Tcb2 transposase [Trichonephila clavipes]